MGLMDEHLWRRWIFLLRAVLRRKERALKMIKKMEKLDEEGDEDGEVR